MRRIIRYSGALLFAILLASSVAALIYLRGVYGRNEDVSPVRLDRTLGSYCTESSTTNNFQEFWGQFREAVAVEDKDRLFSLTRKCAFQWWDPPRLPLRSADCIPGPIDCDLGYAGGRQIFESQSDFDETYNRIFTKANRNRILNGTPWETGSGYAISWETNYGTYSLKFDRVDGVGYKFSGLDWEPIPLEMLKVYAAKTREEVRSSASPPPN